MIRPLRLAAISLLLGLCAETLPAAVRYVWRDNPNTPTPPYTAGWDAAATNIQDAVDYAVAGDTVLVTNGFYDAGGRIAPGETTLYTRLVITNGILVTSVNGPDGTFIVGRPHASATGLGSTAIRGVYLATNAVLAGFTVTNGNTLGPNSSSSASYWGGGVRCESTGSRLTNCVIVANNANARAGGVHLGTLVDCLVATNGVRGTAATSAGGGGLYNSLAFNTRVVRNVTTGGSQDGGGVWGGSLAGCTVVSNVTVRYGGGVYSAGLTNCTVEANASSASGGGAYLPGAVTNTLFRGNTAVTSGGGVYQATLLLDCALVSNRVTGTSSDGGGFYGTTGYRLVGCSVVGNSAVRYGGGVYNAILSNCVVRANRALGTSATTGLGGGFYASASTYFASRCRFLDNAANYQGGGAYYGKFFTCVFSGNRAQQAGGFYGTPSYGLYNCSVLGNSASNQYGGTYQGIISNCIVYGNTALTSPNYSGGTFAYSCASPLPSGTGNFNADPLVSGYRDPHLLSGSPCLAAGAYAAWMASATDLDGEARSSGGLVDVGADQHDAANLTGPLAVAIVAATNVCSLGDSQTFLAEAEGRVKSLTWDFGDGAGAAGVNPASHVFDTPGLRTVRVTVSNDTGWATATFELQVADYVLYVSPAGSHTAPFDTWETAATNIQDAVDAVALAGGRVRVTNGVYDVGSRAAPGQTATNRLVLNKAVRVESVNGPAHTAIVGRWNSTNAPLGGAAVRGVYIGADAVLAGFTVSNGATLAVNGNANGRGGGLFVAAGGAATNCVITACRAWSGGGAAGDLLAPTGALYGCTLITNVAVYASASPLGGGAAHLALTGCTVLSNACSSQGGGVYQCAASGCTLAGNVASQGGGAYESALDDCLLRNNVAAGNPGGGAYYGVLRRCRLLGNSTVGTYSGGGAYDAALYSCVLAGNAASQGGGAYGSTLGRGLFGCTVAGNTARIANPNIGGGGVYCGSTNYLIRNCIVYHNTADSGLSNNTYRGTVEYSCVAPLQAGPGNLAADPQLASFERPVLLPGSPCAGAGLVEPWMAGAADFEGDARTDGPSVDIGADQSQPGGYADALTAEIAGDGWPYFPGTNYTFTAVVGGHPTHVSWDFGDHSPLSSAAAVTHAWAAEGLYTLRLTVSNAASVATAELLLDVAPDTRYVSLAGSHTAPFRTWETAANTLQAAADALGVNGRIKVAAGVYDVGGCPAPGQTLSNRLYVGAGVAVIGVAGRDATFIVGAPSGAAVTNGLGAGAIRGVYLAAGSSLQGFTVTNGFTFWSETGTAVDYDGGGVACYDGSSIVRDCAVAGCAAAGAGGGVYSGTVLGSLIERNAVCGRGTLLGSSAGGGVYDATLVSNCVVRANRAGNGGGGLYLYEGAAVDCLIDGNTSAREGGGVFCGSYPEDALLRCTVVNNAAAGSGGGVFAAVMTDCLLTNNAAVLDAGGYLGAAGGGQATRCRFVGNRAGRYGGGVRRGDFYRCRFVGNGAAVYGGGAYGAALYSSTLSANAATNSGGGAYGCTLESCSVLGNTADVGGGAYGGAAYSSLLYFNSAATANDNWSGTTIAQCCTVPAYNDVDDVTAAPQVTGFDDPHLLPGSPCIDAGLTRGWMGGADGLDLDEEPRITGTNSDLGADERDETARTGPLSVSATVDQAAFGLMYAPEFRAEAAGQVGDLFWDFGDGTSATNQNPVRHAFPAMGEYTVRVTVTNQSGSAHGDVTVLVTVGNAYVSRGGGHVPPFASWADAATNIQDAVDAAIWGGTVWVTNGVYGLGGRPAFDFDCTLTNRVCVNKPLVLRSVEGPAETVIVGQLHGGPATPCGPSAVRGVWLSSDAVLIGFTITNGATLDAVSPAGLDYVGGGVFAAQDATVSNCWVTGCYADGDGGGGYGGLWLDCRAVGNRAAQGGGLAYATADGGASECGLTGVELTGNTAASNGGGAYCYGNYGGWLIDCELSGNEAGQHGGGAYGYTGSGCAFVENTAADSGGGAYRGPFDLSLFDGNRALSGDGGGFAAAASGDWLSQCTVINNQASRDGGGCHYGELRDCLLTNNAAERGGGYFVALLDAYGALYRCRVWDNQATFEGGGVHGASLYSCVVAENRAGQTGGGTYGSILESCSVQGNSAAQLAGGCHGGEAYNSVLFHNTAPQGENTFATACATCCTPGGYIAAPPQTTSFREPRLLPSSPCLEAGAPRDWMSGDDGLDMDGEARVQGEATEIGADEAAAGAATGPLTIRPVAEALEVAAGYALSLRADIGGQPAALFWDFGDAAGATNQNPLNHAFAAPGVYTVRATATNSSHSVFGEVEISVVAGDVYVALSGTHTPPFATWATAATNIQDGADATPWGGVVHLADGVYRLGGRPGAGLTLTNRVCLEQPVTLRSLNGPGSTMIEGAWHSPSQENGPGSVRGVYLGHPAARLEGVHVQDGATELIGNQNGGGVYARYAASVISNCVISGCTAASDGGGLWGGTALDCSFTGNTGDAGGGASEAALTRCSLQSNSAGWYGGGAYKGTATDSTFEDNLVLNADGYGGGLALCDALRCTVRANVSSDRAGGASGGTLVNCLLCENTADNGGGACDAVLYNCTVAANGSSSGGGGLDACSAVNCIVWGNTAPVLSNANTTAFSYSLTTPPPAGAYDGGHNIDADPQFVSAATGNFRLRGSSPAVDAGTNLATVVGETDLDGLPRVPDGFIDLGTYEYASAEGYAALGTPIAWLEDYYAGPDWDAAELDDSDGDGYPAWQEYIALTDPTDPASFFAVRAVAAAETGAEVSFDTALGRVYTVQRTAGLAPASWSNAAAPVAGTGGRVTVPVTDAAAAAFYRVRVSLP